MSKTYLMERYNNPKKNRILAMDEKGQAFPTELTVDGANLEYNIYEGEDLIIKYADEIAKYSDEWAWIKARIKAVNFKGLRIHDYIPVKCSNNKVLRMEIAGIDTLKNVIVEKNFFKVNRYTEGSIRTTDNTDWGWFNLSKLWLPTEKEVYGSSVYEGNSGSYGIFGRQYPCFIGNSRFKGIIGNINARCNWWLLSPYSGNSSSFCNVNSNGNANNNSASNTNIRVPV